MKTENGVKLNKRIIRMYTHKQLPNKSRWWTFKLLGIELSKEHQDLITKVAEKKKTIELTIFNSSSYTLSIYLIGCGMCIVFNVPDPKSKHKETVTEAEGEL